MSGPSSDHGPQEPTTPLAAPPSDSSRATEPQRSGKASSENSTTAIAPPFRPLVIGARKASPSRLLGLPEPGQRLDDFELLQILGEGSFGRVYLAKQISLGRQVALKVLANRGNEARTMASLEHDHIIRVFAETVRDNFRLLCMQYVPGTNLDAVFQFLARLGPGSWNGQVFLKAIDQLSTQPAALEPAFLRDREFLDSCDSMDVICWIGTRLAEALDYAHGQGILHRDIKPANILVNRYGRPMLADFSLACASQPTDEPDSDIFGGTLAYMSPEHLEAFVSRDHSTRQAVDQRSDLYSLGVVLFEFLIGKIPFPPRSTQAGGDGLAKLAEERRAQIPSPRVQNPEVPEVLDRVIRRCLDSEPERRYQTAAELAKALEGCRQLRIAERGLPASGPVTRLAQKRPFVTLILLALLPNILGSAVNISYNFLRIVTELETTQQNLFKSLLFGYNVVIYGICLAIGIWLLVPISRTWKQLIGALPILPEDGGSRMEDRAPSPPSSIPYPQSSSSLACGVADMRRRALALPLWAAALSCAGWIPGGIFFPLALQVNAGVFVHFLFSFTISGLIALTYSGLAVQWVVLRILYPKLWVDGSGFRQLTRTELTSVERRLRAFQFLAGLIPLAGAAMILWMGPETFNIGLRLLAIALIGLGMAGVGLGLIIGSRIQQTLSALVG